MCYQSNKIKEKIYVIKNFCIKTMLGNEYIDKYFYYRFYGFCEHSLPNNSIDLCVVQKYNVEELKKKIKYNISADDFNFSDEDIVVNVVNYKNFLVFYKKAYKLEIYLEETDPTIERILAIKLVSMALSLLLPHNMFCLHGSCVSFNNNGLLLMGNSGSGKTSLSLKFVEQGFKITNDDATFIKKGNRFEAIKNTQFIGLTEDGINCKFEYLYDKVGFIDEGQKYRIDLNAVDSSCFENSININKLVWIDSNRSEKSSISFMKKSEMMKNICQNISAYRHLYYDVYLNLIAELVMRCDCYILHPSNNLNQTFECLIGEL